MNITELFEQQIQGGTTSIVPPWGQHAYYEEEGK